jgi:Holliday junction resolvase RusA-like endonuclease
MNNKRSIKFFIEGAPVAQGRPRFGNGRAYDPPRSREWKQLVQAIGRSEMNRQRRQPFNQGEYLYVSLEFHIIKPKSTAKKCKYPTVKPDIDNFTKAVLDGLNGICYHDDAQIVHLQAMKIYSGTAGVAVRIEVKKNGGE